LREPDLSSFSGTEIAIVEAVIRRLWGRSAAGVSDLSHRFIGWKAAADREVIPYETVFLDNSEPGEAEIEYARELERSGR
jgi:hypothetical protein